MNVNKFCAFRRKAIVPSGPVREVFSHPISVETTASQSCLLLQLNEQRFVVSLLVPANAITALINDLTCCATDYSGCTCKPRDDEIKYSFTRKDRNNSFCNSTKTSCFNLNRSTFFFPVQIDQLITNGHYPCIPKGVFKWCGIPKIKNRQKVGAPKFCTHLNLSNPTKRNWTDNSL